MRGRGLRSLEVMGLNIHILVEDLSEECATWLLGLWFAGQVLVDSSDASLNIVTAEHGHVFGELT